MNSTLPWFSPSSFPLYLAPMAGVSDKIFRQLCKERGADVLVTEFVSAEGVFRRNERTREYLDFDECERPIGVQLLAEMRNTWRKPRNMSLIGFGPILSI